MKRFYTELYAHGQMIFLLFAAWLSLARGDVIPSFLRQPMTSQVTQHAPVTIYCDVAPSDANVKWLFDSKPLSPQAHNGLVFKGTHLFFTNFEYSNNEGIYQCVASTSTGAIISEPLVIKKPVLDTAPTVNNLDIIATINGVATLPCRTLSSNDKDQQVFIKNNAGQLLDKDTDEFIRLPSGSILIKKVLRKHQGQYQCVVVNTQTNTTITTQRVIDFSVQNEGTGSETAILEVGQDRIQPWRGNTVILECPTVSKGSPDVQWNKYGGTLPQDRSIEFGNLRIENAQIQDDGTYICQDSNGKQKIIAMEVLETISAAPVAPHINASAGERVQLQCNVIGRPDPKVTWYHNAQPIGRPSTTSNGGAVFVIDKVAPSHMGLYQCQATNNMSSDSGVMKLEVRGSGLDLGKTALQIDQSQLSHTVATHLPYFTIWPTNLIASPASNVALPCFTVNSRDIQWFKDDRQLVPSNTARFDIAPSGSLQLFRVVEQDSGKYSCIAKNENGTASAVAYLTVLDETTMGVTESDQGANNETTYENVMEEAKPPRKKKKPKNRKKKKRRRKGKNKRKKHRKKGTGTVKLVPPSRPNVEQLSDTSVMLNWTVPQNDGLPITFFRVQYKTVMPNKASWHTDDREIDKDTMVYEVKNLKPGGVYKFRIAAVYSNNDNKMGPNSRRFVMKVAPAGTPHRPVEKPTIVEVQPLQLEEKGKDVFGIGIKWQYLMTEISPIEGFFIFYKPYDSDEQWKHVTILETKVRIHVLKYLKPDTEYSIRMQCFNSAGRSEFSNTVVKRSFGATPGDKVSLFPPFEPRMTDTRVENDHKTPHQPDGDRDRPLIYDTNDDDNSVSDTHKNSEKLYMGIGIAMGFLLLILVFFIVMCWWKQRQQRRMMGMNGAIHAKFQDQSHRIYSESMRKKYMNGYPLNGLNGMVANGHVPHGNGTPGNKMNINVNPMTNVESRTSQTQSGKGPNHTIVANGSVPHYNTSDNNFNSINSINTAKNRDEIPPDQPLLAEHNAREMHMQDPGVAESQSQGSNRYIHPANHGHSSNEADMSSGEMQSPGYNFFSVPGGKLQSFDGGTNQPMFTAKSNMDSLSPSDHNSGNHGRHKRRRKRPHSREHATKDQATNTDLSSNEGTIEFTTFNKSPSPSDKSQSFTNSATQCSDYSHMNGAL